MVNETEELKIKGLNKIREDLFALYPNATKISVIVDGDKIKVAPNEEYAVPFGDDEEE